MDKLSPRQTSILEYIYSRFQQDGILPSYREIGDAMGIRSTNGVSDHIKALTRKGYLQRVGGTGKSALARAMRLTDLALTELSGDLQPEASLHDLDMIEVGVYGSVAAGLPALAVEHREETLRVDRCMIPGAGQVFALRVSGESMIEDGILPGDYIFVRKQLTVRDGEIAVVMVDGECTVKRFFREGDRIRLQPANSTMEPIYVAASEFREVHVVGIVSGVFRKMG
ncbi:MAG: repressor LexA [Rickettsiales bacterium]|nr:repressor LexA [Rickettsiales bacterium]|tara:strand:+ start:2141 stop:2818 length:678 start_codon:yes stop_codon:yes gene_type:complete